VSSLGRGPKRERARTRAGPRAKLIEIGLNCHFFLQKLYFDEICLNFDLYSILHQHVYCLENGTVKNASEK
jgi:hypothetical protein